MSAATRSLPRRSSAGFIIPLALAIVAVGGLAAAVFPRGSSGPALVERTTVAVLSGELALERASGVRVAVTRETDALLATGDRLETGGDARAVVTYPDGSTTELEPETVLVLERLSALPRGGMDVAYRQVSGQTWNVVSTLQGSPSRLTIATESALVETSGASFILLIDAEDIATVDVYDGAVLATPTCAFADECEATEELATTGECAASDACADDCGDSEECAASGPCPDDACATTEPCAGDDCSVLLAEGFRTNVAPGRLPDEPLPIPAVDLLRIDVLGPVRPFLVDNANRSLGFHPTAEAYGSQIPGSTYRVGPSGQTLTLAEPAGAYDLVLSARGDGGPFSVSVSALPDGRLGTAAEQLSGSLGGGERLQLGFSYRGGRIQSFQRPGTMVSGAPERSRMLFARGQPGNAGAVELAAIRRATAVAEARAGAVADTAAPAATRATLPTPTSRLLASLSTAPAPAPPESSGPQAPQVPAPVPVTSVNVGPVALAVSAAESSDPPPTATPTLSPSPAAPSVAFSPPITAPAAGTDPPRTVTMPPDPSPTATETLTPMPTLSPTLTSSPTVTATATWTPWPTPTPLLTVTPTQTASPSPTVAHSPSPTR